MTSCYNYDHFTIIGENTIKEHFYFGWDRELGVSGGCESKKVLNSFNKMRTLGPCFISAGFSRIFKCRHLAECPAATQSHRGKKEAVFGPNGICLVFAL